MIENRRASHSASEAHESVTDPTQHGRERSHHLVEIPEVSMNPRLLVRSSLTKGLLNGSVMEVRSYQRRIDPTRLPFELVVDAEAILGHFGTCCAPEVKGVVEVTEQNRKLGS